MSPNKTEYDGISLQYDWNNLQYLLDSNVIGHQVATADMARHQRSASLWQENSATASPQV